MILVNNDDCWFKLNDLNGLFFGLKWTFSSWWVRTLNIIIIIIIIVIL
jgi:hypothetical protein